MNAAEAVRKLEASSEFTDWKKENKDAFLSSLFAMFDKEFEGEWLASYYSPSAKKVTTFFVDELECLKKGDDAAEKQPKMLDMSRVKTAMADAVAAAKAGLDKRTGEGIQKTIAILQNLDEGQVWNVSLMTSSFNMFNIKIDAETGKEISQDYGALFRSA